MAFLKPQNPIKKGEDFVYPLTTVDQVILDDNSRLNAKMVTVDLNTENDEVSELPTRDAETLGGIPASEYALKENIPSLEPYALKTDTAPDSALFGGLPPEAYALVGETGVGVPTGGTTGQVLAKNSAADYDTQWVDAANPDVDDFMTRVTHEVTVNSDFVSDAGIVAQSIGGILTIGGYFCLPNGYSANSGSKIICRISGITIEGNVYTSMMDRNERIPYLLVAYTDTNNTGDLVLQMEGTSKSIASNTWPNFTMVAMLEV